MYYTYTGYVRSCTFLELVASKQAPAVDVRPPDLKPVARRKRLELSVLRLRQGTEGSTRRTRQSKKSGSYWWCQVFTPGRKKTKEAFLMAPSSSQASLQNNDKTKASVSRAHWLKVSNRIDGKKLKTEPTVGNGTYTRVRFLRGFPYTNSSCHTSKPSGWRQKHGERQRGEGGKT